ncbi:hypothetical protein EB118_03285 [bacterium]|nr:hypothetical protein [bacterium]
MKRPYKDQNKKDDIDKFDPKKFSQESELTNSAILHHLESKLKEKNIKRKDIEALVNTVQEFLNCFIILGYNFDGEPINFISAHNQQEADSLATLVNKIFINNNLKDNS